MPVTCATVPRYALIGGSNSLLSNGKLISLGGIRCLKNSNHLRIAIDSTCCGQNPAITQVYTSCYMCECCIINNFLNCNWISHVRYSRIQAQYCQ